jgi:hypothetical protein
MRRTAGLTLAIVATWPWAEDELGEAAPEVLPAGELNLERIARLPPDVIVGIYAGLSEAYSWADPRGRFLRALGFDEPLFRRLDVVRERRDVHPAAESAAALSFSSPLSLPSAIDSIVPQLEQAVARAQAGAP